MAECAANFIELHYPKIVAKDKQQAPTSSFLDFVADYFSDIEFDSIVSYTAETAFLRSLKVGDKVYRLQYKNRLPRAIFHPEIDLVFISGVNKKQVTYKNDHCFGRVFIGKPTNFFGNSTHLFATKEEAEAYFEELKIATSQ